MNEIFVLFDRILHKGVCLWLKQLNVDFPKDVEHKKAYFAILVENEGKRFLNALQQEIDAAYNELERSFIAHKALNVLEQKLERIAVLVSDQWIEDQSLEVELIRDQKWREGMINIRSSQPHSYPTYPYSCVAANARTADVIYILQLVKSQLIRLYLEVQDVYKKYLSRNVMTLEDIHWAFFGEVVPAASLVDANRVNMDERKVEEMVVNEMSVDDMSINSKSIGVMRVEEPVGVYKGKRFEPLMRDARPVVEGVLAYDDIVANKTKFAQLEVELFINELVDTDYRFKRKPHGNVMKMAAVYWVSFKKGYFTKHYFKDKRRTAVTANDVRTFLNHRYQTNIERQFQNFGKKEVLNSYLDREVGFRLWLGVVGDDE